MKVRYKKIHPDAVVPFKKYKDDFCYDVVATSEEEVAPNVWKYGIGLAFEIERGEEISTLQEIRFGGEPIRTITSIDTEHFVGQISLDLRPRSSVWKTGMVLSNCIGTIDAKVE